MPRKKKGGSWGDSPDKFTDPSFGPGMRSYVMSSSSGSKDSDSAMAWSDITRNNANIPSSEQEKLFQHIQEMFKDQIEPNIIHMILDENNWKGWYMFQLNVKCSPFV